MKKYILMALLPLLSATSIFCSEENLVKESLKSTIRVIGGNPDSGLLPVTNPITGRIINVTIEHLTYKQILPAVISQLEVYALDTKENLDGTTNYHTAKVELLHIKKSLERLMISKLSSYWAYGMSFAGIYPAVVEADIMPEIRKVDQALANIEYTKVAQNLADKANDIKALAYKAAFIAAIGGTAILAYRNSGTTLACGKAIANGGLYVGSGVFNAGWYLAKSTGNLIWTGANTAATALKESPEVAQGVATLAKTGTNIMTGQNPAVTSVIATGSRPITLREVVKLTRLGRN